MTEQEQNERIKALIISSREAAKKQMAEIKEADPLSKDFFHARLRAYVLNKYLLSEEDVTTENFNDLTEISMSKSMKVSKDLVKQFDLAKSCDGGSSAMAKKVLLFLAIQRELGILLPARESASFKTLTELVDLTWNTMTQSENWKDKLQK